MKSCVLSILVLMLFGGCSPRRPYTALDATTLQDVAISMAIQDFSTSCPLFKRDSVFYVAFEDSVFHKPALVRVNERSHTHEWIRGEHLDGEVCVCISGGVAMQYTFAEQYRAGLPTRYAIRDNKLFYWKDDNYPVSEEMINVLRKYGLLTMDDSFLDFYEDDSRKGADYYFCKNNPSKYKRVVTNIAFGYYEPPILKGK